MPVIVIETVRNKEGTNPSLIEQANQLIEEIRSTASRMLRGSAAGVAFDQWLQDRRDQFWAHQFELIEDDLRFRIRMAVPNCGAEELRATVTGQGIDVRSADNPDEYNDRSEPIQPSKLIRHVELSSPIDASTVTALAVHGELRLSGAKAALKLRKRAIGVGG